MCRGSGKQWKQGDLEAQLFKILFGSIHGDCVEGWWVWLLVKVFCTSKILGCYEETGTDDFLSQTAT